jgi:hypothetical protein
MASTIPRTTARMLPMRIRKIPIRMVLVMIATHVRMTATMRMEKAAHSR